MCKGPHGATGETGKQGVSGPRGVTGDTGPQVKILNTFDYYIE